MLPPDLHALVPSGRLCRECLVNMYHLGMRAARGVFGPLPIQWSAGMDDLMIEMQLLQIEAALQEPRPADRAEVERRWRSLLEERMKQRAQSPKVDLDYLQQWLSRELGGS
jgi:hypothetical protein